MAANASSTVRNPDEKGQGEIPEVSPPDQGPGKADFAVPAKFGENPYRDKEGRLIIPEDRGRGDDLALKEYSDKFKRLVDDQELADRIYDAIPDSHGGKVHGTDIAREMLEEYASSREGKMTYMNATGDTAYNYAKDRFWRELHRRGDRRKLLFTAGGVGAGKSSVVNDGLIEEADLVFDGTLRDVGWAKRVIEEALELGWEVRIEYVERPLDLVVKGVVERTEEEGRWGAIYQLPEIHRSAQESIRQIAKKFRNNSLVEIHYWRNDGDRTKPPTRITFEQIDRNGEYSYDKVYEWLGQRSEREGGSSGNKRPNGRSGALREATRRVKEAFRREVESGDYEPRILRLLAKGDTEFEAIVENYLKKSNQE